MKKISIFIISFCFLLFNISANNIHTNDVIVNTKNSTVTWTGSKPGEDHSGTINISSGKLTFDHGRLVGGEFVIDMSTIKNTDIESARKREYIEEHLKNEDFFDVEKFPTAKLVITGADPAPDNVYKISANLTIKDITHKIIFSSHVVVKKNNFSATANIKIDRTKWDVVYKSGNIFKDLGDKIIHDEINFDIFLLSEK
tara:strand:- start:992 stop:1588 length:597 start_codon:yes stop_codon:yes gene_type:complete